LLARTLALLALLTAAAPTLAAEAAPDACVPVGRWVAPGEGIVEKPLPAVAERAIVLLGEHHTEMDDHRWQLQTIAGLHALHPDLVLGFEMFPRRVQPVLDRWSRGELGEREFLAEVGWDEVWGYDPKLYLPILNFARMNRLRMVALNVDRALPRRVSDEGWAAVPPAEREGVADPAPPTESYRERLRDVFSEHRKPSAAEPAGDVRFERFLEAQLLWDAAMAQALAEARRADPTALVVGIMGAGHLERRDGIPHQLASTGTPEPAVLLPWERDSDCDELKRGYADLVFGIAAPKTSPPLRLGVALSPSGPPRVLRVEPDSIAARAGLKAGDVILAAGGRDVKRSADVRAVIDGAAAGYWLPLRVKRGGKTLTLVAKFPA
jgi:uncharacterized iron-regulated protein